VEGKPAAAPTACAGWCKTMSVGRSSASTWRRFADVGGRLTRSDPARIPHMG